VTVGSGLRALRKAEGLSVPKVAQKAGLSNQTVYLIEAGKTPGKLETIASLAKAHGCTVHLVLIDGDNSTIASTKVRVR
jgi:transcriptional regulator with XRE-family HTH domain